jgi:hypothetical protein
MNTILRAIGFEVLRYATMAWDSAVGVWDSFWDWYFWTPEVRPTRRYFLTSEGEQPCGDAFRVVPEQLVYVEEWLLNGTKKCVVRYTGDPIPDLWEFSPHALSAKCPWIWVGDRNTEIDLTQTFSKFLVPGNRIKMELVERLIRVTDQTRLVYIEYGSFEEKEFPGEGLLIKANGSL